MVHPYRDFARLAGLARDERGASAVEFALVMPVLLVLTAGAIDTTRLIAATMQVRAAAQAGADFALNNGAPSPWNPAPIQGAVTAATTLTVTPSATQAAGCVSGALIVAPPGPLCADGGTPGSFVTVGATASFAPIVPWNGVVMPTQVSGQAKVRLS